MGQNFSDDWERKMIIFVGYINKNEQDLILDQIGNMDGVPVIFDIPTNFTFKEKDKRLSCYFYWIREKYIFMVTHCATANVTKLSAYVIFRRKTTKKTFLVIL